MLNAVAAIFTYQQEVFWITRQTYLRAFPGYTAFPGGKVDEGDEVYAIEHPLLAKFPAIEVSSSEVTHWLHIVETSSGAQFSGKHASLGNFGPNWVFVDVGSQEKRDSSYPFYSLGKVFRDNPGWTSAPHITLTWNGKLFGLSEIGGVFYPVGAVSWGFNLKSWSLAPEALSPKLLDKSAWLEVVETLNDEYPGYVFSAE